MGHFKVIVYVTRLLLLNTLIICTMLPFETNALRLPHSRYLIVLSVLSYAVRHVYIAHMIFTFCPRPRIAERNIHLPVLAHQNYNVTSTSSPSLSYYLTPSAGLPIKSPHTRADANVMDLQHRTGEEAAYLPPPYRFGVRKKETRTQVLPHGIIQILHRHRHLYRSRTRPTTLRPLHASLVSIGGEHNARSSQKEAISKNI
jgi:hypothetical protein